MLRRRPRPLALGACAALSATGLLLAGTVPATAATTPSVVSLSASAYGSYASVGPLSSGRTASLSACSTKDGATYGQKVAGADLGRLGKVGAVVTSGKRTGSTMVVTSTTGATSLLDGLVQVQALKSTASARLSGSTLSSSGSTVVTGLKIAGKARAVPSGVGARIDVPDVARITVNRQTTATTGNTRRLTVEALRIDLLKGNRLGLDTGTIVLGLSSAGASRPTTFVGSGQAYGTSVDVAGAVVSSPTAYVGAACGGTGGDVVKSSVTGVAVNGLLSTGAVSSTGQTVEGSGTTTTIYSNKVTGVNLLKGVVTADAVSAKSQSTRSAAGLRTYHTGTTIANLKVLGRPVTVTSDPNRTIDVAGIGTLTLHKTVKQSTGLDVVGIELKLGRDRDGLKAGTVLQVAVAKSRVAAG